MFELFLVLVLLQIKHWYIDFVNQSMEEVNHKGIYLDWRGVKHSFKQGAATTAILVIVLGPVYLVECLFLGAVDFIVHYHTDWLKMNYGNRDITTPQFWNHLGLDQMVHQLTYIFIAAALVL